MHTWLLKGLYEGVILVNNDVSLNGFRLRTKSIIYKVYEVAKHDEVTMMPCVFIFSCFCINDR